MVLTDDNFATIVVAIEAGRQVYDNVRKFIQYIFAHATPEVVPFLVFALSGGAIPLPLTVLQLLAFDVGSETLPSLALGRDPIEPGSMDRPPRPSSEGVIQRADARARLAVPRRDGRRTLTRWLLLRPDRAGWHPGDPVGAGHPLHHAYLQATTMTFAGDDRRADRHRVRGANQARIAAIDRRLQQPLPARRDRRRAAAGRRLRLRAAAAVAVGKPQRCRCTIWCSCFLTHSSSGALTSCVAYCFVTGHPSQQPQSPDGHQAPFCSVVLRRIGGEMGG